MRFSPSCCILKARKEADNMFAYIIGIVVIAAAAYGVSCLFSARRARTGGRDYEDFFKESSKRG